jgi:F-type H+-transporting ATPase subunit delta
MADELVHGYAEALFKVAQTEGALDKVEDELFRFGKLLETNHELKQALSDSNTPRAERIKVLDELLADKVSRHTMGLVTFIVAQDRARQLPQILEELSRIAAESRKTVLAEVRSAVPLDDDQSAQLADALSKATGMNVSVKVLVDESVIGGIYAKVGDTIIDGTVKRRLEQLKEQVKA